MTEKYILVGLIWIGAAADIAIIGIIFGLPWYITSLFSFPIAAVLPDGS